MKCKSNTKEGLPCGQDVAADGSGLCVWHDPNRRAEAVELTRSSQAKALLAVQEAAAKRVKPFAPPPDLELTPDGLLRYAGWVAQAIATGQLDVRTANALSYTLVGLRKSVNDESLATALRAARAELAELRVRLKHRADR